MDFSTGPERVPTIILEVGRLLDVVVPTSLPLTIRVLGGGPGFPVGSLIPPVWVFGVSLFDRLSMKQTNLNFRFLFYFRLFYFFG